MIAHVNSILQSLFFPLSRWYWPAGIALVCIAFAFGGDAARIAFRWEQATLAAEPWRALTGHLLHLDGNHLILNLAGFAALWALVGDAWRTRDWSLAAVFIALVISVGLLASDGLAWYVGLSGVLHGLLAMGAVGLRHEWRAGAAIIVLFLVVKGVSESTIGAPADDTIVAAHWWGAGAGFVAGIMAALVQRRPSA
jgi:rhomboid family GlyGly-CTERM serine protease